MTFDEWYTQKGFARLEEAAVQLSLAVSTVSRMRDPGYKASAAMVDYIWRKTGRTVRLEETSRHKPRKSKAR